MTKTILITGSTDGIGKLAALTLAKQGHHVYLHGRNANKLASAVAEVKAVATGDAADNIDGFVADLSNLSAIKHLASEIIEKLPKLDVLINNAGVYTAHSATTKTGLDVRFMVNYLAPHKLTRALLPLLKASNSARIINLSSAAQTSVSYNALLGQERLDDKTAYAQSKLALTIWSMGMADRLSEDNINIIAVNPGSLLNTKMVSEAFGQHWSSADKGANILTKLATSDEFANETGRYFDNDIKHGVHGDKQGDFGQPHADALNSDIIKTLEFKTQQLLQSLASN